MTKKNQKSYFCKIKNKIHLGMSNFNNQQQMYYIQRFQVIGIRNAVPWKKQDPFMPEKGHSDRMFWIFSIGSNPMGLNPTRSQTPKMISKFP